MLSDINALNTTGWGQKALEEAIIPDSDGRGGVTIKFKGSPLEQKEIYISAEEIVEARKSGNYVADDDDVIAFELATEKTFREMVRLGLAERTTDDDDLKMSGLNYRSYIFLGVKNEKFDQYPFSELLGINTHELSFNEYANHPKLNEVKDDALKWFSNNKNDTTCVCSFLHLDSVSVGPDSRDSFKGFHAYAVENIEYGQYVIIRDPHYSDYKIKVPWNDFVEHLGSLNFSFKDDKTKQDYEKMLPKDYETYTNNVRKFNEELEKLDKPLEEYLRMGRELHIPEEEIKGWIEVYRIQKTMRNL